MVEEPNKPQEPAKPEFEKKLEEIRAENERMEKNIEELKNLKAMDAMGGGTNGNIPKEPPKVETSKEYADKVMRGEIKAK